MGRSLGRFKISGVLTTTCIGPFQICIQKILDLGQQVFVISGTFINRKKGLLRQSGGSLAFCICSIVAVGLILHPKT